MSIQPPALPPGAALPERTRSLRSHGLALRLSEWGDPDATPLVLCHGMFDHGLGFALLAPRLAERFRVIALDARGHGDSDWADAYGWPWDVADVGVLLRELGRPAHLVGHSRGGGQCTDAAVAFPEHVLRVVNLDGFGPPPEGFSPPGRPALPAETTAPERMRFFLDRRRKTAADDGWRSYAHLDALVERRRAQNPRLGGAWLRWFCGQAARRTDAGWVWKADPLVTHGFGPWQPDFIARHWARLERPLLALSGSEPDTWGPLPEPVLRERLAGVARLERDAIPGAGHFMHMEAPAAVAARVLAFLTG